MLKKIGNSLGINCVEAGTGVEPVYKALQAPA